MTDLERLQQLLNEESTLVLSSADEHGATHATPLFYIAGDALHLYWLSSPRSVHSRNVRTAPECAVAVFHSTADWRAIRGAQMRGHVEVVRGARRKQLLQAYAERFQLGATFRLAMARSSLYEFTPAWIRYLDNSVRFGYKVEIEA